MTRASPVTKTDIKTAHSKTEEILRAHPEYRPIIEAIVSHNGEVIGIEPAKKKSHRISFRQQGTKGYLTVSTGSGVTTAAAQARRALGCKHAEPKASGKASRPVTGRAPRSTYTSAVARL